MFSLSLMSLAAVTFLSCEPLLKPIALGEIAELFSWEPDWVIVGGESGPVRRPMQAEWVRVVRDDCAALGVPFFFKQWGGLRPGGPAVLDGREHRAFPVQGVRVR